MIAPLGAERMKRMYVQYLMHDSILLHRQSENPYTEKQAGDIVYLPVKSPNTDYHNDPFIVESVKETPMLIDINVYPAKLLECSSKGDERFSALHAWVEVYGVSRSIEGHYQMSKRFNGEAPKFTRAAKGRKPDSFVVGDYEYPLEYFSMWYKLLWLKYLDNHPELVEYASQYDGFTDMFKGKNTRNCQADVIRQYVKEGRRSIVDECLPLIWAMRDNNKKHESVRAERAAEMLKEEGLK